MNKVPFGRATLGMNIVYIIFSQKDSKLGVYDNKKGHYELYKYPL